MYGGQLGCRSELDLVRDTGALAAVPILGPPHRQVDPAVDQRVPAPTGIAEKHPDLRVLDPASGAGALALHPDRLHALLQIPRLVDDQYRLRVTEPVDDHRPYAIADSVGVPHRPIQQPLHRVRAGTPSLLRQLPARLDLDVGQQAGHEHRRRPTRLNPPEPARERIEHPGQNPLPPSRVYAMARGHRQTVAMLTGVEGCASKSKQSRPAYCVDFEATRQEDLMKAMRHRSFGASDVLVYEEVERPAASAGQVVLRVAGTLFNLLDVAIRAGILRETLSLTTSAHPQMRRGRRCHRCRRRHERVGGRRGGGRHLAGRRGRRCR